MVVEWLNYAGLSEIGGNYVNFSLVKQQSESIYKGLHSPFVCKDFMTDVFWNHETGNAVSIYGFNYAGEALKLIKNQNKVLMAVRLADQNPRGPYVSLAQKQEGLELFLNKIQELIKPSFIFQPIGTNISEDERTIVIHLDKGWTTRPYLISLFTYLIRVGIEYKEGDVLNYVMNYGVAGNDYSYRKPCVSLLELLKEGKKPKQSFADFKDLSSCHNRSGFVSLMKTPQSITFEQGLSEYSYRGVSYVVIDA